MAKIRVTKEFSFETAHALDNYDGACRYIHGHSYRFFVTVIGEPCSDISSPQYGMVIDFKRIKAIVNRLIVDRYDHSLVLRKNSESSELYKALTDRFEKVDIVDYQPTCENMISRFAEVIQKELPSEVTLHSLKLHETATSFAEWYAEDNQ